MFETDAEYLILDYLPIGLILIDSDLKVKFWNSCIENWTKIKKRDIINNSMEDYFAFIRNPKYKKRIESIFDGGPPVILSSQLHKHLFKSELPGGEFRIHHTTIAGVPSKKSSGYDALFVVEDVTELTKRIGNYREMRDKALDEIEHRKQAEQRLKEAQKELSALERKSAAMAMIVTAHHELNQPLTVVNGRLDMLEMNLKKNGLTEVQEKQFTEIKKALNNVLDILEKYKQADDIDFTDYIKGTEMVKFKTKRKND